MTHIGRALAQVVIAALVAAVAAGVAGARDEGPSLAAPPKIVYQSRLRGGNYELYVVRATGGAPVRLTRHSDTDASPTWSPDGSRIAFESNRTWRGAEDGSDVFIVDALGRKARQLTFADRFDGDPAWGRGGRVAFESERFGQADIWTIRPDGSGETRLTTSPAFDGDPSWSPSGDRIVFTSTRDGNKEVYVMDADGQNQERLTDEGAADFDPAWSPDGRTIAFASIRDGNVEVYAMSPDGSNLRRLTDHAALDALPAWSPDGSRIVFVSDRVGKGQRRLYTMSATGTAVRPLTKGAYDMSPDWTRG